MPFLRFSKDRRGYESTFLLHAQRGADREAPLLLYWFRTPPHVKMGRAALDEDTIRALEDTHPSVDFDWPRILASRPQPSEPPPDPNRPPRARRRERGEERGAGRPPKPPTPREGPPPSRVTPPSVEPTREAELDAQLDAGESTPAAPVARPAPPPVSVVDQADVPPEPEAPVRRFTRIFDAPPVEPGAPESPTAPAAEVGRLSDPSASDRALGGEQLERLRGRYAALLARIARRITDPALADRLRAIAERANPDTWVTDDEVKAGLAGLNDVYAELVPHIGRRRRRRRAGRRNRPESVESAVADSHASPGGGTDSSDAAMDEDDDEDGSTESGE